MKKILFLCTVALAAGSGCTITGSGSQDVLFNPFNIGSSEPALKPANEDNHFRSDSRAIMGIRDNDPWDMR